MPDIAELGLFIDSSGVIRATKELRKLHNQSGKNEDANKKLSKSFGGLRTAVAAAGVALLTKQLIGQINTYTELTNKLRLVTSGSENLAAVQDRLFSIAQESRGSLEATNDLYFRLAKSTTELGISQSRLADVTETVNKAVAISGTTAQAASAALFQMGQGLAAGALRGQELNSVMEQTPRVAQAIADGMGVPIGALRGLAEQGLITSEVVISAFEAQAATIDEEFGNTSKTITQALQQIENTALQTFGSLDATELTGSLDEFRTIISDPDVVAGLQSIASVLVEIAGLAVMAAAGWGLIFSGMAKAADEGSRDAMEKLQDRISKAQEELAGTNNAQYRAVLEASLTRYRAELESLTAAKEAQETAGGDPLSGTGQDPAAAAEAIAMRADAQRAAEWEATANAIFDATEREDILTEIAAEKAEERKKIAEDEAKARESVVNGMFGNLVSLMNSGSKKMFNIGKVSALANGLLNLRESVMSAYAAGSEVGGPIVGAAYAATAGLAQAANLAQIKSASFGGGGGGATVSSTTGGNPVTGQLNLAPPSLTQEQAPLVQELRVVVESDGVHSDGMRKFAQDLADTIEDMGGVGRLVVS